MTAKDKQLIKIARSRHWSEWGEVSEMVNHAETEEARRILHKIAITGYRTEEFKNGNL